MTELTDIESVKWGEISKIFEILFPDLIEHLNTLLKKTSTCFYRARYPFGSQVVSKGVLNIPFKGKLIPITSGEVPASLRNELMYTNTALPICAVTKGVLESHIDLPSHLVPLRVLKPGTFFSLNNIFHPDRVSHIVDRAYTYTAGSRSLLVLPKISHEQYNERLTRAFTIDPQYLCPKTFFDQWPLFKELASAPEFKAQWETELIICSKEFFDLIQGNDTLRLLFLTRLWSRSLFTQNQMMYDLIWSIFSEELSASLKNTPFVVETVKHVMKLAMAETPGYTPSTTEAQGPIEGLMDIFLNVYRIRYYLPIFMELGYFNKHDPIYYSLQKHTFLCHIPQKTNANRTIDELLAVQRLIHSFRKQVLENKFPVSLENTILYKTLQEVEFDFFHPQGTEELNTNIDSIVKEDPRFMNFFKSGDVDKDLVFPKHSLFFNGCIRIRSVKRAEGDTPLVRPSMKDFLSPKGGLFRLDDR